MMAAATKDFPLVYLNSNDGSSIIGFGGNKSVVATKTSNLDEIQHFLDEHKNTYIFCYIGYDVKNQIEKLSSQNYDGCKMPNFFFFSPQYVAKIDAKESVFLQGEDNTEARQFITDFLKKENLSSSKQQSIQLKPRTTKENYLRTVKQLKQHIQQGDIYEITYCQEFYQDNVRLTDPIETYFNTNAVTKGPFSAYLSFDDNYILCGSPERFLQKDGETLISQPIKGTAKRGETLSSDQRIKTELLNDPKERAENVMIVDLVRNDLSKIAKKNSVKVEELFGIYSFETVHQMISTIKTEQKDESTFTDLLRALFPMGSMTGAPKYSAMKLIEVYEDFKRGVFSGSIGYIKPNGDFDLNVVIRSILYNAKEEYISCPVGGAITINSDPEKEYEECITKIGAILKALNK
ncbi:MAG: anthranilate synthase component I family protein [Lishizhenia sp.]